MNYLVLKEEISEGALSAEMVGKSDNEIADILNDTSRQTVVRSRFVTARTILAEVPNGAEVLDKLDAMSAQIPSVKWAMHYLKGETGIDIGHPGTITQLDALATGGVLTNEEATLLKNMALQPISRAEIIGLGSVSYNDVNVARALK